MMVPLVGMGAAGLLGSWWLARRWRAAAAEELELPLQNPFSLRPALKFGAIFVGTLLLVEAANAWLGAHGIYLASAVGGMGSVSAISLSVAEQVGKGTLSLAAAPMAILIAVTANAIMKWLLALINGTRELALHLGGGLLTMLATGALLFFLLG